MGLNMNMMVALLISFVITFILTWAIREGGSFAFLHPGRWRRRPDSPTPDHPERRL